MGWQERAARYFPETHLDNSPERPYRRPDNPPRASVPSVPASHSNPKLGTVGTLARRTLSERTQHDAHISAWYDWQERAAIIEFDGGLDRATAERLSARTTAR